MNKIRLNILDSSCVISGRVHSSVADALVAALSAEPVSIKELPDAVSRFIGRANDSDLFESFDTGTNDEPWDAGIMYLDLAAHAVATESSCLNPLPKDCIQYHDGTQGTDVWLPYQVPADWLFFDTVTEYKAVAGIRRAKYGSVQPLDARTVLYGKISEFAVLQCLAARDSKANDPVPEIHAKWLMTPRGDLHGQSPRDVLLRKFDFINADLQSRALQWSFMNKPAPCLNPDSHAYRFAGFGIHEVVTYYKLVRLLLSECWKRVGDNGTMAISNQVANLERVKTEWLESPDPGFGDRSPAYILECERKRLPLITSAEEIEVEDDCPLCKMMAEDYRPTFWHLDGCNMDDDYPFSFCRTREEWEAENRRREKFDADFNRHWEHRKPDYLDEEEPLHSGHDPAIQ